MYRLLGFPVCEREKAVCVVETVNRSLVFPIPSLPTGTVVRVISAYMTPPPSVLSTLVYRFRVDR